MSGSTSFDCRAALAKLQPAARKLLAVIVAQTQHGTLRSKAAGVATMPEVHEACGLDPEPMQVLMHELSASGLLQIEGDYPFEELRPQGLDDLLARAAVAGVSVESALVDLHAV